MACRCELESFIDHASAWTEVKPDLEQVYCNTHEHIISVNLRLLQLLVVDFVLGTNHVNQVRELVKL